MAYIDGRISAFAAAVAAEPEATTSQPVFAATQVSERAVATGGFTCRA